MIKALLYFGANINSLTKEKETALHKAAMWNRRDVVIYLLSKGADPLCLNVEGLTAKDCAAEPEVIQILSDWDNFKLKNEIDYATLGKVKKYH